MTQNKSTLPKASADARAFTIVLGDLRTKLDVFGEALQSVRDDVGTLRQDVSLVREDVSVVREDVNVLRHDVSVLRQHVDLLKIAVVENVREVQQLRKAR